MFDHHPLRHPLNDKLRLYYDNIYQGFDVSQRKNGPLIENYLERAFLTLNTICHLQREVFVFRIDLRFPDAMQRSSMHDNNDVLAAFFRYFRHEIRKANTKHQTPVRYLWAREQDTSDKPHYHVMMFVNKAAFDNLGYFAPDEYGMYTLDNLYHRMMRAWLKAMGFDSDDSWFKQLVHVSENPVTEVPWSRILHRHDWVSMDETMFMASYLCKAHSKTIGKGMHVFDYSRA
ncbi:inovirus-type Gp2 protein [Vreelandella sp. SM1641]|uniref:Inovirus-type Gp2 protein n=1 Tax=Vreelandella sp. SM1641 TaxID=3126101 RepID=A0AAU7XIG3_9GAMM